MALVNSITRPTWTHRSSTIFLLFLLLHLPSLATCLQHNWWNGLRNGSGHASGEESAHLLDQETWSSPLPVIRPLTETRPPGSTTPSPTSPMAPATQGTSPQASAWTPVITSDFNSMQSTEPAFLLPLRDGQTVGAVTATTATVANSNTSRVNESLVDSSSNLRRSASKFADEFDAIVSSKSFAPAIKATSKELFREKEIYFDHESFQPSSGDSAGPDVSWDDKVEFPPSTTTTVAFPRPARTNQAASQQEGPKEVTVIDHDSNGKLNGATSSTWFTSSSLEKSDKSDKLQTKGKTNVVKKSGRRIGQFTSGQEKERLVQTSTSAPIQQQQQGPFVDSEDLRAAYEKEISEIQSGAVSGEKYEDLSDSFKVQPRKSIKAAKPSPPPATTRTTTTTTSPTISTSSPSTSRERLVKGSIKRPQSSSLAKKSELASTASPLTKDAGRRRGEGSERSEGPSAAVKSGRQVQQGKTSRVGKLKSESKSQEESENEQVSAPVKGGRVVKGNLSQSQEQEKVQQEAKQDKWPNAKVTAYFNWAKSDSSSGQSPQPNTRKEDTSPSPQLDRVTKGRAKGALSKTSPGQATRSRAQESVLEDNESGQDEPLDEEFERVTLAPTSTTSRPPARRERQQRRQGGSKSARIVDTVSDLRRISAPTTTSTFSPPRKADFESQPEEVSELATTPSPGFRASRPTSRTQATTSATIQSSAGLKAAFDSAFKAAVTNEQLQRQSNSGNNNDKQQKQVTSAKVVTKSNNNSNNRIKSSSKSSLFSGGKSSLSIETGNFAWSTDIEHTGDAKAEVKLITRKSGQLSPNFESGRLTSEPEDEESPDDDTFLLATTTPPPPPTTLPPKTTARPTSTSRRFVGGITRSAATTTAKPMTTASFVTFTEHQSTSLPSTTSGPSSQLQGTKGVQQRSGSRPLLEEFDEPEASPLAARKVANDGNDSNDSSSQAKSDEENSSQFSKKSGIQYSSVVYESSLEREEGGSGEQKEPASGENGDDCRLEDAIPGTPLTDYPAYQAMPATSFKCSDVQYPGYYGDMEAQCQVFHVCQADGRKNDFLCPVGTIFNQELFVCDWWQNFRCADTPMFYSNNANLYFAKESVPSNQLRKRTDAIEREGIDATDDAAEGEGGDVLSEEVEGNDYSSREGSKEEEEETAVSRPPGPLTEAVVSGAVKGGRSKLSRQSESVKSSLQGQSRPVQRRNSVKARVSAGYGARLLPLEDSLDTLPLASNLARTTSSLEGNWTTPSPVTSTTTTTTTKTTTATATMDLSAGNSPLTKDPIQGQPSETLPSSYSSNSYSSVDSASLKLQSSPVATYISPLEPIFSSSSSSSSPSSSRDVASTYQLVNLLAGQSSLNNG